MLHLIAAKRLGRGRLTVVDATDVQPGARRPLLWLARELGAAALPSPPAGHPAATAQAGCLDGSLAAG